MSKEETSRQFSELENESKKLFEQYLKIREKRISLKKSIRAGIRVECDSDYCHTEKKNEPISGGETDEYYHDDQDGGNVSVRCLDGEIEVIISAAVWSDFDFIDSKVLRPNDVWTRDIPELSSWYDQTNRVRILGRVDSHYNLDFKSWDD